jgi:hypothetical protein
MHACHFEHWAILGCLGSLLQPLEQSLLTIGWDATDAAAVHRTSDSQTLLAARAPIFQR